MPSNAEEKRTEGKKLSVSLSDVELKQLVRRTLGGFSIFTTPIFGETEAYWEEGDSRKWTHCGCQKSSTD